MSGPKYHGWTHRPASEGGTDPIPSAAGSELKWASAHGALANYTKSGSYYRLLFNTLATNDDGTVFELAGISGTTASWLQINEGGFYEARFAVTAFATSTWGTSKYRIVEPIIEVSAADSVMNSDQDYSDHMPDYNPLQERQTTADNYRTIAVDYAFNFDPGTSFSSENPLKLAMRVNTDQTGTLALVAQLYVRRANETAGYTLTDLT